MRQAGVLLHPTSLPGGHGVGDLGEEARHFVRWMAAAGLKVWQILPLVPPGGGDSPYSSWSALAGNPWLISLDGLVADGLLPAEALNDCPHNGERVDFAAMKAFKGPRLQAAARALAAREPDRIAAYRRDNEWVESVALFDAIWRENDLRAWWDWPPALRDRMPEALATARVRLAPQIDVTIALQCLFDQQWSALRAFCDSHEVTLLGDVPIYVDGNSADVWAHRELFDLDASGRPSQVAGVPPDGFSATGQLWGNPLYRWDRLAETDYAWWVARLRRVLSHTGSIRIDHFRAFSAYWAVPAGAEDARSGRWVEGPGASFFERMAAQLGTLPVVAEDLGVIDQGVLDLLEATGFPGMKVLQFAFGGEADNFYLPHNHVPNSVVYTGTHDNNTTLGWWLAAPDHETDHVRRYYGISGHDLVWDLIGSAFASVCDTAIVPAQDILALDASGRMNTPAVAEGNWGWRLAQGALSDAHCQRLAQLGALYGRR